MTPIESLLRHLDRNPNDFGARLVLADMLTDAGSPMADGMRYLGVAERIPLWDGRPEYPGLPSRFMWVADDNMHGWSEGLVRHGELTPHALPVDLIKVTPSSSSRITGTNTKFGWRDWLTIRGSYAAAAMGFYRLPAERQHELLARLYNPTH